MTSPWDSLTRYVYPRTVLDALAWAEELWDHHGLYRSTIEKAVRYFITDVQIEGDGLDVETRRKYKNTLEKEFRIQEDLAQLGQNYIGFGNEFVSMYAPFTRFLYCQSQSPCGFSAPLKQWWPYIQWSNFQFKGKCPCCGWHGVMGRRDRLVPEEQIKPVLYCWAPQHMLLSEHCTSKRKRFQLDLSKHQTLQERIKLGDRMYLEDTPWELIEAMEDNSLFEFEDGQVLHMAYQQPTIKQERLNGWGLPPFMCDFEDAVRILLLDKMTEAIITDHLIPFRVLTPAGQSGNPDTDPMMLFNMQDFKAQVSQMLKRHRQNPTQWNFMPVPLEQQLLGGDAGNIPATELMEYFERRLLFSMGIPTEIQTAQTSVGPLINFKLFEQQWGHFANVLDSALNWMVSRRGELMAWEDATVRLTRPSVSDDMQIKMLIGQEYAAGKVSQDTYFTYVLGLDPEYENRTVREELRDREREMVEDQREMEESGANMEAMRVPGPGEQILMQEQMAAEQQAAPGAMGGAAPGPAMIPPGMMGSNVFGGGGGGNQSASLEELQIQAQDLAMQLMQMDGTARQSTLRQLASSDETLHALVKSTLSKMESQAEAQGLAMARQGQIPMDAVAPPAV